MLEEEWNEGKTSIRKHVVFKFSYYCRYFTCLLLCT